MWLLAQWRVIILESAMLKREAWLICKRIEEEEYHSNGAKNDNGCPSTKLQIDPRGIAPFH